MSITEDNSELILIEFINTLIEGEPWYFSYLSNKGLVFTVLIMIIVAYNLIRSRTTEDESESKEFRGIKNLLSKSQNMQGKS